MTEGFSRHGQVTNFETQIPVLEAGQWGWMEHGNPAAKAVNEVPGQRSDTDMAETQRSSERRCQRENKAVREYY